MKRDLVAAAIDGYRACVAETPGAVDRPAASRDQRQQKSAHLPSESGGGVILALQGVPSRHPPAREEPGRFLIVRSRPPTPVLSAGAVAETRRPRNRRWRWGVALGR